MLSTAETLLGLTRHLSAYQLGPDRAALGQLEFAGQVFEMAVRLRGSGVSPGQRVLAIGLDAGITKRQLLQDVLPTLQTLSWIDCQFVDDTSGTTLATLSERVPPLPALLAYADRILAIAMPDPTERAVVAILDATSTMPITRATAIDIATDTTEASEQEAERAIDLLSALHLVSSVQSEDGVNVLFNPNIWAADVDYSAAALRAEDGHVRREISALLEEIGRSPGLPESAVTATSHEWIDYAVSQGLVQRSLVQTSSGDQRAFLFSPHMGRNAFEDQAGVDPSGHVRQLIGSMVYAKNFATYKLWSPATFLRALIRDGEAGDASSIGSDYPMLETAGIMRVEPGQRFYKLVLLQSDIAERAEKYLEDAGSAAAGAPQLRDQRTYIHPEQERARRRVALARPASTTPEETRRLMAALRQAVGNRNYGR